MFWWRMKLLWASQCGCRTCCSLFFIVEAYVIMHTENFHVESSEEALNVPAFHLHMNSAASVMHNELFKIYVIVCVYGNDRR